MGSFFSDILGTFQSTFKIGKSKATLDASGLTAARTHTLPDASVSLAGVAGQLGGTGASPDVRGLRETSGPTLLTLGSVADGEYLKRSGSNAIGGSPAPNDPDFLVKTAHAGLSAERVVTDTFGTDGVTWNWATAGQAKATVPYAGKWVAISSATASGSSSIDFTGFSNTYIAYKVLLCHVAPATNTVQLWVRTSSNGGSSYDSGASDYAWTQGGWSGAGGVTFSDGDQADAQYNVTGTSANQGNAANRYISGVFTLFNPPAAKYGQMQFLGNGVIAASGNYYNLLSHGVRLSAADIDGIRFMFSSGNIASGAFYFYGLTG